VDRLSATTEVLLEAFPILDVAGLNTGPSAIAAELAGCPVVGAYAATTLCDDDLSVSDFEMGCISIRQ
jgi:hypothetical protein